PGDDARGPAAAGGAVPLGDAPPADRLGPRPGAGGLGGQGRRRLLRGAHLAGRRPGRLHPAPGVPRRAGQHGPRGDHGPRHDGQGAALRGRRARVQLCALPG
ncbi:unnamed protein product, partial [Heterosigma akashiwo]